MSAWIECVCCNGRGRVRIEREYGDYSSFTFLERITGYKTCPQCDGMGKILIE